VPVTTAPNPGRVKNRSTGRRNGPLCSRGEGLEPFSGAAGEGDDRRPFQKSSGKEFPKLFRHELQPFPVHQIPLGQNHDPPLDPQERADIQMFAGLGHDPLVGGDDEHDQIDPRGSRHHGPDEPLVSRHVHDPQLDIVGKIQVGKAQLDGDPPAFFLLETVRIGAGKSLHEAALPMVDMSGRTRCKIIITYEV
jgi:hypothetical protein